MNRNLRSITLTGIDNWNLKPGDDIVLYERGDDKYKKVLFTVVSVETKSQFTVKDPNVWRQFKFLSSEVWFKVKMKYWVIKGKVKRLL